MDKFNRLTNEPLMTSIVGDFNKSLDGRFSVEDFQTPNMSFIHGFLMSISNLDPSHFNFNSAEDLCGYLFPKLTPADDDLTLALSDWYRAIQAKLDNSKLRTHLVIYYERLESDRNRINRLIAG